MLYLTILKDNKEQTITINQKQICSFHSIEIIHRNPIKEISSPQHSIQTIKATEVRMSNGDVWCVILPPFEDWHIDAFTTNSDY